MKDLVMITDRFSKLEVAEEMGKPAVKTSLVNQGDKEGRWESGSGEEDVINNKGDSCGKRREDSEDTKGGKHLRAITMMKILPRPLTFWYLKNENTREWNWKQNQVPLVTVKTEEDFWHIHNYMEQASKLDDGCDFSIFKQKR